MLTVSLLTLTILICASGIALTEKKIRANQESVNVVDINRKKLRKGKVWGAR